MKDLRQQFRDLLRGEVLDRLGPDAARDLADLSLTNLLITYENWQQRVPVARPRKVYRSCSLANDNAHKADIEELVKKIESGESVRPHLSKSVAVPYAAHPHPATPLAFRRDLDVLLADWNIHHLHLSRRMRGGWVRREDDLLFAMFTNASAYLIDVMDHQSFGHLDLLKIVIREWPNAGLVQHSLSAIGLTRQHTNDEIRQLQGAGIATLVEIDGTVYMPRGQTVGGTPIEVTRTVLAFMREVDAIESSIPEILRHRPRGRVWRVRKRQQKLGLWNGKEFINLIDLGPLSHDRRAPLQAA